jgi:hypothetical protein
VLTNPLAVAAVPLGAVDLARRLRGHDSITARVRPIYIYALAIVITAFAVLRNIAW